jgi:hypothetical protein
MRRGALLAGNVPADASDDSNGSTIEFTAAVDFKRRGVASKIVVPGLPQQNQASNCDPALINAIARGRAWFDELAAGPGPIAAGPGGARRDHPTLYPISAGLGRGGPVDCGF